MSTSFFDVLMMWLGSGPSSPKYCQMVTPTAERSMQFGEDTADGPSDLLQFTLGNIDAVVAAPANALAWRVPDLSAPTVTADQRDRVLAAWPPLRRLNGAAFTPRDARGDGSLQAVLLEVFPAAYRRLEYLFSSLEVPVSMDDWDIPRYVTPRWFWIRGFGEMGLADRFRAIAEKQWEGRPAPAIEQFLKGLAPIYVNAGETLGKFEDGTHVQVRAFDSTGLPIDPDFVFATFGRLAEDSDFGRLKVDHPEHPPQSYEAERRHVIVFCDQEGKPYTPRPAEPFSPTEPDPPTEEAQRRLLLLSPGTGEFDFAEHGVLTFQPGAGLGDLTGPIGLGMAGSHVRLGSYPNGELGKTISVDFAPKMFLRLQVLDYHDWFQRNANPRNRLTRYTEGNLITPLVDGADFFKELYRILRATYKDIDPATSSPAFDPYAPVDNAAAASSSQAKILLSNAWIEAQTPLLGARGLISAPKTQDASPDDLPSYGRIMEHCTVIAARSLPGLVDVPFAVDDQAQWWIVSDVGMLPPGACVEIRQVGFADTFHGDDPRLASVALNADIFGIVAPFPRDTASSLGFVSATGRFVLPVIYRVGTNDHKATFRVTLWPPNATEPVGRTYGEVTLPEPADFMIRPPEDVDVQAAFMRLEYEGIPGEVVLVLPPGTLSADRAVIVMNARSGEAVAEDHTTSENAAEIRIVLTGFALQDRVLVGFPVSGITRPEVCPFFYELYLGRMPSVPDGTIGPAHADPAGPSLAALANGEGPAHPTELAGILREAITAGVDVRLLGWNDPLKDERDGFASTRGTVNCVNHEFNGRRGQAILDSIRRETFHVHHQKGSFIRTASLDFIAFLGGIDIVSGRWDTNAHRRPDPERPSSTWHDVQCKVEGKAAWDVYRNFMQRWNVAVALPDVVGHDPGRTALPPPDDPMWGPTSVVDDPTMTKADGPHAAQISRTLAPHLDAYGGAAAPFDIVDPLLGDVSVKTTWTELLKITDRYLYLEDQYFWIRDHAIALHQWLRQSPDRFLFLVLPRRFSDLEIADQVHYVLRRRCVNLLLYGIPDTPDDFDPTTWTDNVEKQVAMFHLASAQDQEPIYVHSKLVIADDTWFTIGSANVTRRSWTFDSEINAACIDVRLRRGGHVSARQLRVDLLAEHLQLKPVEKPLVENPRDAFMLVREILDNKRPWMETHLMKVDLKFTHYGELPRHFDPVLTDLLNLVIDTDGTQTHFDLSILDAYKLIQLLRGSAPPTPEFPLGQVGRYTFTFDVNGLGRPANEVSVVVNMREQGAPDGESVTLGPWPATDPVDAGLIRIGTTYAVLPTAVETATLNVIATRPEIIVNATEFVTTVNLVF